MTLIFLIFTPRPRRMRLLEKRKRPSSNLRKSLHGWKSMDLIWNWRAFIRFRELSKSRIRRKEKAQTVTLNEYSLRFFLFQYHFDSALYGLRIQCAASLGNQMSFGVNKVGYRNAVDLIGVGSVGVFIVIYREGITAVI